MCECCLPSLALRARAGCRFLRCGPGPADTWGTNRDRFGGSNQGETRIGTKTGLRGSNREKRE